MSKKNSKKIPLWIFSIWAIFISGAFAPWVGSPGVIQAIRLSNMLNQKQAKLEAIEDEIQRLEVETARIERSRPAQEREIRRQLGYVAEDELIFDFNTTDLAEYHPAH